MYSLFHSLLTGVFWDRRACPPTVGAATVILERLGELGLGANLASTCRPGTSRRTFQGRLVVPEPGHCNDGNHGDDYEKIHSTTFHLTAFFVTQPSVWWTAAVTWRFQSVAP